MVHCLGTSIQYIYSVNLFCNYIWCTFSAHLFSLNKYIWYASQYNYAVPIFGTTFLYNTSIRYTNSLHLFGKSVRCITMIHLFSTHFGTSFCTPIRFLYCNVFVISVRYIYLAHLSGTYLAHLSILHAYSRYIYLVQLYAVYLSGTSVQYLLKIILAPEPLSRSRNHLLRIRLNKIISASPGA